jgi:hypothetical protein
MPASAESAGSRRFVASARRMSPMWAVVVVLGTVAASFLIFYIGHAAGVGKASVHMLIFLLMVPYLGFVGLVTKPKKLIIDITGERLSVNDGARGVFPLLGAKLGEWTMPMYGRASAVALHVGDGQRRFVLGGLDNRITSGMRLEAAAVRRVDAWLSAPDFDALLAAAGHQSGLNTGGSALREPVRCLLFENSTPQRTWASLSGGRQKPKVAIDVDGDVMRLIDAKTNALIAWSALSQVTASAGRHTYRSPHTSFTWPMMDVRVPGLRRLLIAFPDGRRFAWQGKVPRLPTTDFLVFGADWFTLVEKFGLSSLVEARNP